jgi:bacteriocin-like protein
MKTEEIKSTEQTEEKETLTAEELTDTELEKVDGGYTNYHGAITPITKFY